MPNVVSLSPRDTDVLRLLDRTPATSKHLLKASATFSDDRFRDDRRTRERLQLLKKRGFIRSFSVAQGIGAPVNWYKLTPTGWRYLHGNDAPLPHRSFFEPISAARFEHTRTLADVIVHLTEAAHRGRVDIVKFHGEGQLVLESETGRVIPDCHFQWQRDGRFFNVLFEVDNSTETLTTEGTNTIRGKLVAYEAYQDMVWQSWRHTGKSGARPYFRVVFLTRSVERAHNILWLAAEVAKNRDRHLVLAATQNAVLASDRPLFEPLLNDHHGRWQCLTPFEPSARFTLSPIRIRPTNVSSLPL